jgi:cysteine-rich repeat protein
MRHALLLASLLAACAPAASVQNAGSDLCGNGVQEGAEGCDDGNTTSGDGCSDACVSEGLTCGNGRRDTGEQCDDGNTVSGDGCSAACTDEGECGDGLVQTNEECDDGNTAANDGCSADCTSEPSGCGDFILDGGEDCDDGNLAAGDGCSPACTIELPDCGNGVLEPTEECDDGNGTPEDGCSELCVVEWVVCGNTFVEDPEECDDGNRESFDGCSDTCIYEGTPEVEPNDTAAAAANNPIVVDDVLIGSLDAIDRDCFALEAEAGGRYIVETYTSPDTCDYYTTLALMSGDGAVELPAFDPTGIDGCARLDWMAATSGRVLICVEAYYAEDIPVYFVSLRSPVCNDGVIDIGEDCEDGNAADSDGCSSSCRREIPDEIEPNDDATEAAGNVITVESTVHGSILDRTDVDCWALDALADQVYQIETSVTAGTCDADTQVDVYDTDGGTLLASDGFSGFGSCGYVVWTAPVNGRYFVCVNEGNNDSIVPTYQLRVHAPSCGDHVIEHGEQCDDGGFVDSDGCSSLCRIEATVETEPNGTVAEAIASTNSIALGQYKRGAVTPIGERDCYTFNATNGQVYEFHSFTTRGECLYDQVVDLLDPSGSVLIDSDASRGIDFCPMLRWTATSTDRYFVCVRDYGDDELVPSYFLTVRNASCGDDFLNFGEQCDDANTADSDGCSSTCGIEAPAEVEPNDDAAGADGNVLTLGASFRGAITPTGDVDCYDFAATQDATYAFETYTGGLSGCNADTVITLYDATGTSTLDTDDDGGMSPCSLITFTAPASARYTLCVEAYSGTISSYLVRVR